MNFGKHVPKGENVRSRPSIMQTFTRGTVIGGKQWTFRFDNGFGASVINDGYGQESGLYELAVLNSSGSLTYDTPVTDDVLGFLTVEEVVEALDKIEALPAEVSA